MEGLSVMKSMSGWNRLLNDPFFQETKTKPEPEDVERLLAIIREDFFPNKVSLSIQNNSLAIPEGDERKEIVGFQAEMFRQELDSLLRTTKNTALEAAQKPKETGRFLSEEDFQRYVFQSLDFLIGYAQKRLSGWTPSFEEREKEAEQEKVDDLKNEVNLVRESAAEAQRAAEEAKNTADSIMPNMLTTLGVFIAIVIAVVGSYLSVLLTHHASQASTLNTAMLLLMGHILLNIIFLLLYLITKMSAHTLACHCLVGDQMDCQRCDPTLREHCHLRHKLWLRYPYVVAMNGAFAAAYCALFIWYLAKHYFGAVIDQTLMCNLRYAAAAVGAVALLTAVAGVVVFRFLLCSPKSKADAVENKKQKTEDAHKTIHTLQDQLTAQKGQIAALEAKVGTLQAALEQCTQQSESISNLEEELSSLTVRLEQYEQGRNSTPTH